MRAQITLGQHPDYSTYSVYTSAVRATQCLVIDDECHSDRPAEQYSLAVEQYFRARSLENIFVGVFCYCCTTAHHLGQF